MPEGAVFMGATDQIEKTDQSNGASFLNSITPYMKMILPPLEKGDQGGFFR